MASLTSYIFSQDDTGCTLLHYLNGEFKDVAKGKIVNAGNRMMHSVPMSDDVYMVALLWTFAGCDNLEPPIIPRGGDDAMVLKACYNWSMEWPKSQIRLDAKPLTTPQLASAPSQDKMPHRYHRR